MDTDAQTKLAKAIAKTIADFFESEQLTDSENEFAKVLESVPERDDCPYAG